MRKEILKNLVFYFFLLSLIIPNVVLSFTEPMSILTAVANVYFPAGVIYLLASLSKNIGRTIWFMFPLVFFAAFQIVLLRLYGRSIIAVDMFLNLVTTNVSEVSELLGNMLSVISLVVVLYVPSLVMATIFIKKKTRLSQKFVVSNRIAACALCFVGMVFLVSSKCNIIEDIYPANVCYNIYLAADRSSKTAHYAETSAGFSYDAKSTHPAEERELYILIVGETARADNWQLLGYGRPTNPRLSQREGLCASAKAYSESNTTHKSVPMLLSPVDARNFKDEIYCVESIITAFKEAGFSTAFLSNQRYNNSFIDFYAFESDTTVFIKEGAAGLSLDRNKRPDSELLPLLDKIIAQGNMKQLIVLHTYGSHFNYIDRYSKEDAVFGPCDYENASRENRDKLINAYDNTIVATDRLIDDCISRVERLDSVAGGVLYTSDHGEDIFDNNTGRFLHASPHPTLMQIHVPFVAWLSQKYREEYPEKDEALRENMDEFISTSRSYSFTALDMAGIKTGGNALIDTAASLCSKNYRANEPIYLTDHNEAVALRSLLDLPAAR